DAEFKKRKIKSDKPSGAWFFFDKDGELPRLFLVAELLRRAGSKEGEYRYLIDTEARLGTDRHSILVLNWHAAPIDQAVLMKVLKGCAEKESLKFPFRRGP